METDRVAIYEMEAGAYVVAKLRVGEADRYDNGTNGVRRVVRYAIPETSNETNAIVAMLGLVDKLKSREITWEDLPSRLD